MGESFIERMTQLMNDIGDGKVRRTFAPTEELIKRSSSQLEEIGNNVRLQPMHYIKRNKLIAGIRKLKTEIQQAMHEACNPMCSSDIEQLTEFHKQVNTYRFPNARKAAERGSTWRNIDVLQKRLEELRERLEHDNRARAAKGKPA